MLDPLFLLLLAAAALAVLALLWIPGRLKAARVPRNKSVSIAAVLWLLFVTGCAYFAWPLLFLGPDDPRTSMYVQVPETLAGGAFNGKLDAILRTRGFHSTSASIGSPEEPENATYVLEAHGLFTRIFSTTMPLSAEEAVACGYEADVMAEDERQYRISVTAIPFFRDRARSTFATVRKELLRRGYDVSPGLYPASPWLNNG